MRIEKRGWEKLKYNLFIVAMITIIMSLFTVSTSQALPISDQVSEYDNIGYNADSVTLHWQQEVVVGIGGTLTDIDIYADIPGRINFSINRGSGWQSDPDDIELSGLQLASIGWNTIDVSSYAFMLDEGETFVIGIAGGSDGAWVGGSHDPGHYEQGFLYEGGTNLDETLQQGTFDISFRTYMEAVSTTVPEPTTITFLGIGLASFVGVEISRRLKKNAFDNS